MPHRHTHSHTAVNTRTHTHGRAHTRTRARTVTQTSGMRTHWDPFERRSIRIGSGVVDVVVERSAETALGNSASKRGWPGVNLVWRLIRWRHLPRRDIIGGEVMMIVMIIRSVRRVRRTRATISAISR